MLRYAQHDIRLTITFIISIKTKVTANAASKLMAVRSPSVAILLAKTRSKIAKDTIKTTKGSKKATMTLNVSEGPLTAPSLR